MIFEPTSLAGAFVVRPEPIFDKRGFFAKLFSESAFREAGLVAEFLEQSMAHNASRAIIRGLHFQASPAEETKLIRCTHGSIFDVIVDIRTDSPTFGYHASFILNGDHLQLLYVPTGFAHGYQTLSEESTVHYSISARYEPELARGISWDDPAIGIQWPLPNAILSQRDRNHPRLFS